VAKINMSRGAYMKIEIYGANWCDYCKKAVSLCETNNIEYKYIDCDTSSNVNELMNRIGARAKTIPQIFVDGEYLPGGYTGLKDELEKN
jgi:glutaredoxin 3